MRKISPLASKRTSYIATKAYLVSDLQSVVAPLGRPTFIGPEAFDAKNRTLIMAYNCYCSGHTKYLRRRIKGHNEWERWNKNV